MTHIRNSVKNLQQDQEINSNSITPYNRSEKEIIVSSKKQFFKKIDNQQKQQDQVSKAGIVFSEAILQTKIKPVLFNLLKKTPTRLFKDLTFNQFTQINDKTSQYQFPEHYDNTKQKVVPLSILSLLKFYKSDDDEEDNYNTNEQQQSEESKLNQNKIIKLILNNKIIKYLIILLDKIPVFNPSSLYKIIWDYIQLFITVLFIFFIPIHIIYDLHFQLLMGTFLAAIGPLLLIVNNIFYLNMGIYRKGMLISDRMIILQFWYKQLLVQDLISVFPLCIYIYVNLGQESEKVEGNFQIMKYTLLLIIFKFERIMNVIKKSQERYIERVKMSNVIGLFKLLGFALLMCHLFAILFLSIGVQEVNSNQNSWLVKQSIQEEKWNVQYIYSYYFAAVTMMTIGYGDITPQTQYEMILSIFLMLASSGIFGFTLNSINQIFESFFKQENMKQQKLILLNNYMKKKNVSDDLQYQVREYLDYVWQECTEDVEDQKQLESQLSETLKEKLKLEANRLILRDSPIFKNNFSEQVIYKTVGLIKEVKCSPEEIIFMKDDFDDNSIYFIDKGSADIFIDLKQKGGKSKGSQVIKTIKQGQCFGVINFFSGQPRNYNIRSSEFTSLLIIKRSDFLNLLSEFPDDYERFCYIKDEIIINKRMKIDEQFHCNQCLLKPRHIFYDCPYQHFVPKPSLVIKKQSYSVQQDRTDYSNRSLTKYQTLINQFNVTDNLKKFLQSYEQQIVEYEIQNNLDFDNELTEESDSDQENYNNDQIDEQQKETPPIIPPSQCKIDEQKLEEKIIEKTNEQKSSSEKISTKYFDQSLIDNNKLNNPLVKYCKNHNQNQLHEISEELNCFESDNGMQDMDIFQLNFEQDQYPIIIVHTYEDWEKQQAKEQQQTTVNQMEEGVNLISQYLVQEKQQPLVQTTQYINNNEANEVIKTNNTSDNNNNQKRVIQPSSSSIFEYKLQSLDEKQQQQGIIRSSMSSDHQQQNIKVDQPIQIVDKGRSTNKQLSHKFDNGQQPNNLNEKQQNQQIIRQSLCRKSSFMKNIKEIPLQKGIDLKIQGNSNQILQRKSTFNYQSNFTNAKRSSISAEQSGQNPLLLQNNITNSPPASTQALLQQIKLLENQILQKSNNEIKQNFTPQQDQNILNSEFNNFTKMSFQTSIMQIDFELVNFDMLKNFSIYFPHNNLVNVLLQMNTAKIIKRKVKIEKKNKNKNFFTQIKNKTMAGNKTLQQTKLEALFRRKKISIEDENSNINRISSIEGDIPIDKAKSDQSQSDKDDK